MEVTVIICFVNSINLVDLDRIELPTRGSSDHCSTNWATDPYKRLSILKTGYGLTNDQHSPMDYKENRTLRSDLTWKVNRSNRFQLHQSLLATPIGLEPTTSSVTGRCSNHLNYGAINYNWYNMLFSPRWDSNPRFLLYGIYHAQPYYSAS